MTIASQHRDTLYRITQSASDFAQMLGPTAKGSITNLQRKPYPQNYLSIPSPQPITSRLLARGASSLIAENLNQIYLDQASSLKQLFEGKHRQAIESSWKGGALDIDQFITATRSVYLQRYHDVLRDWQARMDERVSPSRSNVGPQSTVETRPAFKPESVPVLEKAFQVNAYPSRADKENIAEQTVMEYKQVNIWFQNRRARAKKEGVSLERTGTFVAQLYAPKCFAASPSPASCVTDAFAKRCVSEELSSDILSETTNHFIVVARPVHAFPAPFPPLCDEDPFPVRNGAGSFQTLWRRRSSTEPVQRHSIDVEQLTAQIANLSLSSESFSNDDPPLPSFAFVPPRAPLPALIRTATALSHARPVATLVSAARSSTASSRTKQIGASRKLHRSLPTRLPSLSVERRASPLVTRSQAIPIHTSHTSFGRPRRSETRSPSPPRSSRSSSFSSTTSRTSSSSWSSTSSMGPTTPLSTSPRIKLLAFTKDAPPLPPYFVHRPSRVIDGDHISSSP